MACTSFASGSQSTSGQIGNDLTLVSVNAAGTYRLWVDLTPMAAGDVVELRVNAKLLSGSTKAGVELVTFQGVQPTPRMIAVSDAFETPLAVTDALEFILNQRFGTAHTYDWDVRKVA
jgi:hypothetical protein